MLRCFLLRPLSGDKSSSDGGIKKPSSWKEQPGGNGDKQEGIAGQFPAAGGGPAALPAVYFELGTLSLPWRGFQSRKHTAKPSSM